jgi:abequosyltransferase
VSDLKLSVCIATLNRGNFIGATLESIISQATEAVEIVVLDGASTDNTEEVVRRFQDRFPRLRFVRQERNMGVDHDFAEAIALARGEYCWLFSDDDLMKPGAIQTVLAAAEGAHGLIVANAEVRNADLTKVLQHRRLPISADRIYELNQDDRLLAEVGAYLSFIGCVIIKRQLWEAREKQKYFGSLFIHVGVIFQSPLPATVIAIAAPLISIRYGNAGWLDRSFEIWMFKWPDLIWSFRHYSDASKLRVCHPEPWRRVRTLLLYRAKGNYTMSAYRKWLKPRLESSWSRATSQAVAYLPRRIANLMAVIYFSLLRKKSDHLLQLADQTSSPFYFFSWCRWGSEFESKQI